MKNMFVAITIMLSVSSLGYAQDYGGKVDVGILNSGSFVVKDSSSGLRIGMDMTGDVKSLDLSINSNDQTHHFMAGFLSKNDGLKYGFSGRGRYGLHLPLFQGDVMALRSETSFAAGFLDAKYLIPGGDTTRFEFNQMLFGVSQYFAARFEKGDHKLIIRAGVEDSGSMISDDYGSLTEWDNYGYGIRSSLVSGISEHIRFLMETDVMQKRYNPSRYFFVENWVMDLDFRSALVISPSRDLDFIPSFNWRKADIERNGRSDLDRPEFGGAAVIKNIHSSGIGVSLRGAYAPWRHKKGNEILAALGVFSAKYNAELYQRRIQDNFSSFVIKESITGVQIAWNFGGQEKHKVKSIEDYGGIKDKNQFYRTSGNQDNTSLTRTQQAERLGTIRKVAEYAGNNFRYIAAPNGGWGFRNADEVYRLRGGDCDEQSCTTVSMNRLNGYKSYDLNYYDFSKWVGHGVEIVQDKTNGQWFLTEYGIPFKVNVPANASLEKVAREAIAQNHQSLALGIMNPSNAAFEVIDCSVPGKYDAVIGLIGLDGMPMGRHRPQVEYGFELFSKRNLLFGD